MVSLSRRITSSRVPVELEQCRGAALWLRYQLVPASLTALQPAPENSFAYKGMVLTRYPGRVWCALSFALRLASPIVSIWDYV